MSQLPLVWAVSQFGASLYNPLIFSSYVAIWYAKISPNIQGRVFAADYLIGVVIESTAGLAAGFLADHVFEPAIQGDSQIFSRFRPLVGSVSGSGIALLYILIAMGTVLIGIASFTIQRLRSAEHLLPDHESFNSVNFLNLGLSRHLNVLNLGDEVATGLGSRVEWQRGLLVTTAVALAGSSVATAGNIGFVGLIAPHLSRQLIGVNHQNLLPVSALVGGLLVAIADLVGRTIFAPIELPCGVVTAAIGAPFFLYLLIRNRSHK